MNIPDYFKRVLTHCYRPAQVWQSPGKAADQALAAQEADGPGSPETSSWKCSQGSLKKYLIKVFHLSFGN